jgi:hypothetical protein
VEKSEPQRQESKIDNPGTELTWREPKNEPAGAAETQHNGENGGGALRDGLIGKRNPSARTGSPKRRAAGDGSRRRKENGPGPIARVKSQKMDESEPRNQH